MSAQVDELIDQMLASVSNDATADPAGRRM